MHPPWTAPFTSSVRHAPWFRAGTQIFDLQPDSHFLRRSSRSLVIRQFAVNHDVVLLRSGGPTSIFLSCSNRPESPTPSPILRTQKFVVTAEVALFLGQQDRATHERALLIGRCGRFSGEKSCWERRSLSGTSHATQRLNSPSNL